MVNSFDFQWSAASVFWLMTSWCCISLNHCAHAKKYVSTPTSAIVCDGRTTTLTCYISQSNGFAPNWRVFTTSDTSGSPVVSLTSGDNKPPYNYPTATVQDGDTIARLEVDASSSINGYHFQCRLDERPPVYSPGAGSITVTDIPSCPTHVNLDDSFFPNNGCDVSLTWQQPPNTPPVTSTTVTYCPTSSPNCGNSTNCTTSPCTISGLDPCVDYNVTLTPTNNCGSATGCTGSMVATKGVPLCPNGVNLDSSTLQNNGCDVSLTWQQPSNTPPITSTTVTYCPTSSPNCGNSMNCTSPCTISGLDPDTEYQFTVIPNNNCGSPTGCTGNTVTHKICSTATAPTTDSTPQPTDPTGIIIGVVLAVVLLALIIAIVATIRICCFWLGIKAYKSENRVEPVNPDSGKSGQNNTAKNKPLREKQPQDDYADPQTVRDIKEMTEENGVTYSALQFSEEDCGNGKNDIHCKEELGIGGYPKVEHL